MRLVPVVIAVAAVLLNTQHASAFSSGASSGAASEGSAGYVDPDDQVRSMFGGKGGDDSPDLGYDANSHHLKQPAQEIINGQGVLIPGSVPATAPSRR